MTRASHNWQRYGFLVAAFAVGVLGLLAALDAPHYTYTGYSRSGRRILTVAEGSPAAAAGLRPGDRLDSVNGLPLRRIGDLEHRLNTGDTWRFVVQRDGALLALQLTPTGQPAMEVVRARSRSVLGFCLVACTLWAFMVAASTATMLLAGAGLCLGFLAVGAPYLAPGVLQQVLNATAVLAFTFGLVLLVHFLLVFPSRGRFLERRRGPWILYTPAVALAIPSVGNVVLPPALRVNVSLLGTLWLGISAAYVLWAIGLLVQRYVTTPRAERSRHGLGLMLGSTLVVVAPLLFLAAARGFWPYGAMAYDAYAPYAAATSAVVPLAFSVAAVRSARSGRKGMQEPPPAVTSERGARLFARSHRP